jgi:hypothetical protein
MDEGGHDRRLPARLSSQAFDELPRSDDCDADLLARDRSTISSVVDFPAPLGPRNPNSSPGRTSTESPSTALKLPPPGRGYRFTRSSTTTAGRSPCATAALRATLTL